jgi:glycosyltransferase involved in cell wall biosynthesis
VCYQWAVSGDRPTVAFDVTSLVGTQTGLGRAVAELLDALTSLPDGPRVMPYAFGVSVSKARRQLPDGTRVLPIPTRALLWAWSRSERPAVDRRIRPADVVHATSFVAPPARLPELVTVHDTAFARYPGLAAGLAPRSFASLLRRAVDRGAWIHCTTKAVASEVEELFAQLRRDGRLIVVPFGIPRVDAAPMLAPAIAARLHGHPFVLSIARLEPRKNLPRLVAAFGEIAPRHPELHLVLAGPDGPDGPRVADAIGRLPASIRPRVVVAGPVDDASLAALLADAAVLCYPSIYEGFGFPMLEAMRAGVPVVAGDVEALAEVAGTAARLVDPLDPSAIAEGLHEVLADGSVRRALIERGRTRAAEFSWSDTARKLSATYGRLAGTAASISS